MALQRFVNSIVFSPPDNADNMQAAQLLLHKQYMDFVRKKNGDRIAFYHLAPGGGRVTPERLSEVTASATVVLFHHGNAEDLGGCYNYAEWFAASFGVAVLMYDYCGYGYSGPPGQGRRQASATAGASTPLMEVTEQTVYSDADDMYAHLLKLGYPAHRIVILGRSVGGGPACYLAEKHHKEIAGLVLISTFTSCLRVVSSCCLPTFCCCVDLFRNYRRVEAVMDCPVLIMHGTDDHVVPYHCSVQLLDTMQRERQRALRKLLRHRRRHPTTTTTAQDGPQLAAAAATSEGVSNGWKAPLSAMSNNSMSEPRASSASPAASNSPPPAEPVTAFDLFQRAYAAVPEAVRNAASRQVGFGSSEVQIGTFCKWLPGCGHNDIENREMEAFAQAIMWFVRFAKAFAAEREVVLSCGEKNHAEAVASQR